MLTVEACVVLALRRFFLLAGSDMKGMIRIGAVCIGLALASIVTLLSPTPNRWPLIAVVFLNFALSYVIPLGMRPRIPSKPN